MDDQPDREANLAADATAPSTDVRLNLRDWLLVATTIAVLVSAYVSISKWMAPPSYAANLNFMHGAASYLLNDSDYLKDCNSEECVNIREGKLYSWRLAVVGWFDCADVSLSGTRDSWPLLNLAWDSEAYQMHDRAGCRDFFRLDRSKASPPPQPRVLAIVGEDIAFECLWTNAGSCDKKVPNDALLLIDSDEATNHWMEPGDVDVATLDPEALGGGLPRPFLPDGHLIAFADGEAWLLANDTPPAALLKFATITLASQHDRDEVLGPYRVDRWERQ